MGMKLLIFWPGWEWCTTSYFGSRGEFIVFERIMRYDADKLLNTALWYWHWNNMAAFSHDLCPCWSKIRDSFALVLWMRYSYIFHLFAQALASKVSSICSQPLLYLTYSYMHAINCELYKSHQLKAIVSMHAFSEFALYSNYLFHMSCWLKNGQL